jgi:hypothetical protein
MELQPPASQSAHPFLGAQLSPRPRPPPRVSPPMQAAAPPTHRSRCAQQELPCGGEVQPSRPDSLSPNREPTSNEAVRRPGRSRHCETVWSEHPIRSTHPPSRESKLPLHGNPRPAGLRNRAMAWMKRRPQRHHPLCPIRACPRLQNWRHPRPGHAHPVPALKTLTRYPTNRSPKILSPRQNLVDRHKPLALRPPPHRRPAPQPKRPPGLRTVRNRTAQGG